jgi:hypothetical protein
LSCAEDDVLSNNKYAHFYDSIRNQWDICKYFDFGSLPTEDDESEDEFDRAFEGNEHRIAQLRRVW